MRKLIYPLALLFFVFTFASGNPSPPSAAKVTTTFFAPDSGKDKSGGKEKPPDCKVGGNKPGKGKNPRIKPKEEEKPKKKEKD